MKNRLTHERLLETLSYDPATGVFIRLQAPNRQGLIGTVAGYVKRNGYRHITIDGISYKAHRLAWFYFYGTWPSARLDHRNTDTTDNRINNLRLATHSQNIANSRLRRDSSSGFKGVSFFKSTGRWGAYVNKDGKRHYLGQFDTAEDAHHAYESAAKRLHGPFARAS